MSSIMINKNITYGVLAYYSDDISKGKCTAECDGHETEII
jgi:hypothetical protein